jgi:hypothetical protein
MKAGQTEGEYRFYHRCTAIPPLFCMDPGMAVITECDQICRIIICWIMVPVVHMEAVDRSADDATISVTLPDRITGRFPGR